MKETIRIETKFDAVGTKVLNAAGEHLVSKITNIEFSHRVGDIPRVRIERLATETVIEGEVEVEIFSLCPCCKRELDQERAKREENPSSGDSVNTADTTTLTDEYHNFIVAPKPKE